MTEVELANIITELHEAKVAISQVGAAVGVAAERIHDLQQEVQERRLIQKQQDMEIMNLIRRMKDLERQFSFFMHQVGKLLSQREYDAPIVSFQESLGDSSNL